MACLVEFSDHKRVRLALTHTVRSPWSRGSVTMGASSSSTSSNTVEVTLQAPACNGHAAPAGAVPLMLRSPH